MSTLAIGDLVRLRSGGPLMVVAATDEFGRWVRCMWFDESCHLRRAKLTSRSISSSSLAHPENPWSAWRVEAQLKLASVTESWIAESPATWPPDEQLEDGPEWEPEQEFEDEDDADDDSEYVDERIAFEDFVDEMDADSESYARCHEDGWFYDDEDNEEFCSDDDADDEAGDDDES